jgi:hypothetical protein
MKVDGPLKLSTMSGDLNCDKVSGSFPNADLSTMSGALSLHGIESSAPSTDYNIHTMSGEHSVKMVIDNKYCICI